MHKNSPANAQCPFDSPSERAPRALTGCLGSQSPTNLASSPSPARNCALPPTGKSYACTRGLCSPKSMTIFLVSNFSTRPPPSFLGKFPKRNVGRHRNGGTHRQRFHRLRPSRERGYVVVVMHVLPELRWAVTGSISHDTQASRTAAGSRPAVHTWDAYGSVATDPDLHHDHSGFTANDNSHTADGYRCDSDDLASSASVLDSDDSSERDSADDVFMAADEELGSLNDMRPPPGTQASRRAWYRKRSTYTRIHHEKETVACHDSDSMT